MALRNLVVPQTRRMAVLASIIFGAGLGIAFVARDVAERLVVSDMQRRFTADAAEMAKAINERLRTHAEVLVSMQGLYAVIAHVDRTQFRRYIDTLDLERRYPGFQALQVLRHVTSDDLAAFVSGVRAAHGGSDLDLLRAFDVRPGGQRPVYNVVEFVEPMRGNENALGFDVGTNAAQMDSLRRAAETGHIVATPPVKLVQDMTGGLGFIVRAPIYRPGEPTQTVTQRNAALFGFVAAVYRTNDLMRGILDARTLQQMHISVVDRGYARSRAVGSSSAEPEDSGGKPTLMYDSLEPTLALSSPIVTPVGMSAERTLVVGERVWRLWFSPNPGSIYTIDHLVPNLAFGGAVIIGVLTMMLAIMTMRSRRLAGDLISLDAEQRALGDNPLAGILFTSGHTILRGNARIVELCGLDPDRLPGSPIDRVLAGDADADAFHETLTKIRNSAIAAEVALRLRCGDGSTVTVDAYGKPLANGDILWVIEDKTDALALEAERHAHTIAMQEANARLTTSLELAEIRAKEIVLLTELSGVLQSCQSRDEMFAAVQTYAGFLFAGEAGALYYLNEARTIVVRGAHWGLLQADAASFPLDDCWALRRGAMFPISAASQGMVCDHAGPCADTGTAFVCQPLIAQNNLLGLLYREHRSAFSANSDQLATMLAEQVSLALANLELREMLRQQAVRDPLTDLYNRRYLEDALVRETARSIADNKPLALAMLDIDHFKAINDTHGHEAGDAVLRGLGNILRNMTRSSDVIGRFGGEEFLLLMPGVSLDVASQRVHQVLDAVRQMRIVLPGTVLVDVTLSIGLAAMPVHVTRGEGLLAAGDAALYDAKRQGRNRVVVSNRRVPLTVVSGAIA